jgi:adenosylcobinamide kinase/adenosylcobinamide-phosphate guanylyltransferase
LIVVSDDAGGGLIPDNACARRFRDLCGLANQRVAERAGRVEYLIAGIPMVLKGS